MARGKPRWKMKLNGRKRGWMCSCGHLYCDPMYSWPPTYANQKMQKRIQLKLCIGCGNKPCTCKNTNRGWKDRC